MVYPITNGRNKHKHKTHKSRMVFWFLNEIHFLCIQIEILIRNRNTFQGIIGKKLNIHKID